MSNPCDTGICDQSKCMSSECTDDWFKETGLLEITVSEEDIKKEKIMSD